MIAITATGLRALLLSTFASLTGAGFSVVAASPGTLTGQVLDTNGKPLAGATVRVQGAVTTGSAEVRTGSDGRYAVTGLPGVPYKVFAWKRVDYRDDSYCLRFGHPNTSDYDAVNPKDGAVRNFRWQLTGAIPDRDGSQDYGAGFFGGTISLQPGDGLDVGDTIELRLEPTGKLIDGSSGQVLTRRVKLKRNGTYALDIPVGPYSVTASVADSKVPLAVGREWGKGAAKASLEFESSGSCNYESGVKPASMYVARTSGLATSEPQASAGKLSLAGTVTVPSGASSVGVIVLACPVAGGCDSDDTRAVTVSAGSFRIDGLSEQPYIVFAWKDLDGDEQVSKGDLVGAYTLDNVNVAEVTPPATGITVQLGPYDG